MSLRSRNRSVNAYIRMKTNTVCSIVSFSVYNSKAGIDVYLYSSLSSASLFNSPYHFSIFIRCFNSYDFPDRSLCRCSSSARLGTYPIRLLPPIVPCTFLVSFTSLNILTYVVSDQTASFFSDTTSRNFRTIRLDPFDIQTSRSYKKSTLETYVYSDARCSPTSLCRFLLFANFAHAILVFISAAYTIDDPGRLFRAGHSFRTGRRNNYRLEYSTCGSD